MNPIKTYSEFASHDGSTIEVRGEVFDEHLPKPYSSEATKIHSKISIMLLGTVAVKDGIEDIETEINALMFREKLTELELHAEVKHIRDNIKDFIHP